MTQPTRNKVLGSCKTKTVAQQEPAQRSSNGVIREIETAVKEQIPVTFLASKRFAKEAVSVRVLASDLVDLPSVMVAATVLVPVKSFPGHVLVITAAILKALASN